VNFREVCEKHQFVFICVIIICSLASGLIFTHTIRSVEVDQSIKYKNVIRENEFLRKENEILKNKCSLQESCQILQNQTDAGSNSPLKSLEALIEDFKLINQYSSSDEVLKLINQIILYGDKSVKPINELLHSGKNVIFKEMASACNKYTEYPSTRIALFNALRQLGGLESVSSVKGLLAGVHDAIEVYEVAQLILKTYNSFDGFNEQLSSAVCKLIEDQLDVHKTLNHIYTNGLEFDILKTTGGIGNKIQLIERYLVCANNLISSRKAFELIVQSTDRKNTIDSLIRVYEGCIKSKCDNIENAIEMIGRMSCNDSYEFIINFYNKLEDPLKISLVQGIYQSADDTKNNLLTDPFAIDSIKNKERKIEISKSKINLAVSIFERLEIVTSEKDNRIRNIIKEIKEELKILNQIAE